MNLYKEIFPCRWHADHKEHQGPQDTSQTKTWSSNMTVCGSATLQRSHRMLRAPSSSAPLCHGHAQQRGEARGVSCPGASAILSQLSSLLCSPTSEGRGVFLPLFSEVLCQEQERSLFALVALVAS